MRTMPRLTTERLVIRPLTIKDTEPLYHIYQSVGWIKETREAKREHKSWIEWAVSNQHQLARLGQPPYGDRGVMLKTNNLLIGVCGLVPYIDLFSQLPSFADLPAGQASAEMGLFWLIDGAYQHRGYATEVARALIYYAFSGLKLNRIIATTDYDNPASIGVMRKVGMTINQNPEPEPPWLQVVGVLENEES